MLSRGDYVQHHRAAVIDSQCTLANRSGTCFWYILLQKAKPMWSLRASRCLCVYILQNRRTWRASRKFAVAASFDMPNISRKPSDDTRTGRVHLYRTRLTFLLSRTYHPTQSLLTTQLLPSCSLIPSTKITRRFLTFAT